MAGTDFSSVGRVVMLFAPDEYGAGASATPIVLDTKGWRWAHISFAFGAVTSAQVKIASIEESDDGSTGWTAVSGALFAWRDVVQNTTLEGVLDLLARKRYIRFAPTFGTGGVTNAACNAVLWGSDGPSFAIDKSTGGADELEFNVLT